jgi:hypothetical protein
MRIMIAFSLLFVFFVNFLISWWIEYFITRKILKNDNSLKIRKAVRNSNLASYAFLLAVAIMVWLCEAHGIVANSSYTNPLWSFSFWMVELLRRFI